MKKIVSFILMLVIFASVSASCVFVDTSATLSSSSDETADTAEATQETEITISSSDEDWDYALLDNDTAEITGYNGEETEIIIPAKIDTFTVVSVASEAFYASSVESVTFPSSVQTIGWWAFYGCDKLENVSLGSGIKTIEYGAFMNCSKLEAVTIPISISSIGADAFAVDCRTVTGVYDYYSESVVSRQYYSTDSTFKINGYSGTYAEKYADDNSLEFTDLGAVSFGDANSDGSVDSSDIELLNDYLNGTADLSDIQLRSSDVTDDGSVDSDDLSMIEDYIQNKISYYDFTAAESLAPETNSLSGMTMYCDGDSVAKGTGTNILGNDYYSYCDYIAEKYNTESENLSVAGSTIARKEADAEKKNKCILERIENMSGDYDIILLDGGFNDLFQGLEIGEITDSSDKSGNYDEYTTVGALERICYLLTENYPDSIKLFVLCHSAGTIAAQATYWEAITDVLEKWGIDYIDISKETDFTGSNEEICTQYFKYSEDSGIGNRIHPLRYAHENIYGPLIAEKLNSLA
ncbi:MAG: leucine-rich repeat protein [Clostridiales bacterium]|nr:leucine-rich repeat protein [Clostridiales bacterium]